MQSSQGVEQGVNTTDDLEWGAVLFDYYQKDYLSGLIEYQYASELDNSVAKSNAGQLLQGGMLLSYGMPEPAEEIFNRLLNNNTTALVRNSAWYYLAKLYYHKSQPKKAYNALQNIQGSIAKELHTEYHYLATLVSNQGQHLSTTEPIASRLSAGNPFRAYILFNYAIAQLEKGEIKQAINNLTLITSMAETSEELATLSDRARHGLAQIALKQGNFEAAWGYLKAIRTSGLYSNRALLTYAWSAIKLKRLTQAIPALMILDERSIAIPEVQEAKVLLAHLYEQEGSPRRALKKNLLAIDAFDIGLKDIDDARKVIAHQDVPREFIVNFDTIIGQTDWYAMEPTVDYKKLTPFVIDLISSTAFNETVRELSDLYRIQKSLNYWAVQAKEHQLILANANAKSLDQEQKQIIQQSDDLRLQLKNRREELQLYSLTLSKSEQQRLAALVESMSKELSLLESRTNQLKQIDKPYQPPENSKSLVKDYHKKIQLKLKKTNQFIATLEPVLRRLINAELDNHENRMRYYLAQSRLAKARLYDATLMELKKAKPKKSLDKSVKEGK